MDKILKLSNLSTLLSMGSTGTGLASAFSKDDEVSGNWGIASGATGALGRLVDAINSGKDIGEGVGKKDKKKVLGSGFGMASSLLGMGAGIADIFGGIAARKSDESGQKRAGMASGILGSLAGIASAVQGGIKLTKAESKADKTEAWSGLVGGVLSVIGGGLGAFGSGGISDSKETNNSLKKTGAVINAVGSAGGWISNIANLFTGVERRKINNDDTTTLPKYTD